MNREERRRAAREAGRGRRGPGLGPSGVWGDAAASGPPLGRMAQPQIHWTPLEQGCGCVIDWGWEPSSADPASFIAWCAAIVGSNCPWHGAESGQPIDAPHGATIRMTDPGTGRGFSARHATGSEIQLGRQLTRQLQALLALDPEDPDAIAEVAPPELLAAYQEKGYDAPRVWLEARISDVLLNRGASIEGKIVEALRKRSEGQPGGGAAPTG